MNVGLLSITASVYQLLRGAEMVGACLEGLAIVSAAWTEKRLPTPPPPSSSPHFLRSPSSNAGGLWRVHACVVGVSCMVSSASISASMHMDYL